MISERGNPSNVRGVDRVDVTAPSPWLPAGTEIVDAPGTGSAHEANTAEARRARSTLDVAMLVVAADPPVSSAELDLLAEVATRASRVVVVVNKIDLVDGAARGEVVAFTAEVAQRARRHPPGAPPGGRRAAGRAAGRGGAAAQAGRRTADTLATLTDIVAPADERTRAALDHRRGDARRLHRALDESSATALARASAAAERLIAQSWEQPGDTSPERRADVARSAVVESTRLGAQQWFAAASTELDRGTRRSIERAMTTLTTDLGVARRAAGELLSIDLSPVAEMPGAVRVRTPSFGAAVSPGWEELVSTTLRRGLPRHLRRRIVGRALQRWWRSAVPRPFGRACSALHGTLREMERVAERSVGETRRDYLDGLARGLAAVRDAAAHSERDVRGALDALAVARGAVDDASTLLGAGPDGRPGAPDSPRGVR